MKFFSGYRRGKTVDEFQIPQSDEWHSMYECDDVRIPLPVAIRGWESVAMDVENITEEFQVLQRCGYDSTSNPFRK